MDCVAGYAEHACGKNLYTCAWPLFEFHDYHSSELLCYDNGLGVADYLPRHKGIPGYLPFIDS